MPRDYRQAAGLECGHKPGKNIPKCGLPPSAHGVEFGRFNLFTRDCRVSHPFRIGTTGKKSDDVEA